MATSSIYTQIRITTPKEAEAFVSALDASEKESKVKRKPSAPIIPTICDPVEIRKLMGKRTKR